MKIKILGNTWEVREVTAKEIGDIMATDKRYTVGACDYHTKTIYILKDLKEEIKKETLIHEISHAILYTTSLNEHLTPEQQEQYCEFLRVAYPVVQDVLHQIVKKRGTTNEHAN